MEHAIYRSDARETLILNGMQVVDNFNKQDAIPTYRT